MWSRDRAVAAPDRLRSEVSGAERVLAVTDQLLPSPSSSSTSAQPMAPLSVRSRESGSKIQVGVPEDLLFFYHHLRKGGEVFLVEQCLLLYRYHPYAATHSVLESTIWQHRVQFLEERALQHWTSFTIWNAGKQGRKLYRSLSPVNQKKVVAFCDVDKNKIKKGFYSYEDSKERPKPKIPIQHFKDADPPFVICVKLDLTGGTFEENLESLNLQEGLDYLHFS
uniref:UDP-GlcNAc:betaGal beta-1,3-N-acetylglucosaminyltransferase like 1 n=1 Tax=Vombatus ursinus TaxID=29139 RepID=A0A4X2L5F5_VOMUR